MRIYNPEIIKLEANEIHLWFAFIDEIHNTEILAAYEKLLTKEEKARQGRFHFERHRRQYLVTRALVRTTLSRYTGVEPRDWRFSTNEYGRPEISAPGGLPLLRFNLSHTDGLIACAVVLKWDIGVDVEDMKRKGQTVEIAERFFSPMEVKDLRMLESGKRGRFFDYWTLKESYIKARGKGLSIPLEQFSFHISDKRPLRIFFGPRIKDDPSQWQFWLLRPTIRHKAALSLRRKKEKDCILSIKRVIPLVEEKSFSCIYDK